LQESGHWNTLVSFTVWSGFVFAIGMIGATNGDTFLILTNVSTVAVAVSLAVNCATRISFADTKCAAMSIGDAIDLLALVTFAHVVIVLFLNTVIIAHAVNIVTFVCFSIAKLLFSTVTVSSALLSDTFVTQTLAVTVFTVRLAYT